jgi:hypothetical protein
VHRTRLQHSPRIRIEDRVEDAETSIATPGAYVVSVSTTLPGVVAELHSVYVGHEAADTQITELRFAPHRKPETSVRTVPHQQVPVVYEKHGCLYDHLQRLQELLAEALDAEVAIDHLDAALDSLRPLARR